MQRYEVVGNLRQVVGPGTGQESMPLGQPGASLIHVDSYAHAPTLAGDGDTVLRGIRWKLHASGLISARHAGCRVIWRQVFSEDH